MGSSCFGPRRSKSCQARLTWLLRNCYAKSRGFCGKYTVVVPHLQTVGSQTSTKYTALTDSIPIVEFLDSQRSATSTNATSPRSENAPNTAPAPSLGAASIEGKVILDEIIALVHSDEADANLLLLSARNADEIKAKALPAKFLAGRTKALTTYLEEAKKSGESERMVNFLSEKLKANK